VAALAAAVWVVLIVDELLPGGGAHHQHHHVQMAGQMADASPSVLAQQPGWMVMSLAMMLPLALPGCGDVALHSPRSRRWRAMALYTGAFVLPWLPLGIAAVAGHGLVVDGLGVGRPVVLAATLGLAVAWQLTRTKRRALLACARSNPLPPTRTPAGGVRADLACLRLGARHAAGCFLSCWPAMLLMLPAGHALVPMAAVTAFLLVEQRHPRAFTPTR
jgi:predicted metal-binding membrane protein